MTSTQRFNPDTPSSGPSQEHDEDLATKIRRLQTERARHVRAIDEIDKVLGQVQNVLTDLDPAEGAAGEHPRRRRYQKLETTGEESVVEFIRAQGNPTTAEVNTHWQQEGRPGVANPILARLLKRNILRRENDPGVRGSRYRINS